MEKCFRCSLCKMIPLPVVKHPAFTDACPASREYHFHGYSTSGKQLMALSLIDGRIEPDERLARITFACTACGYGDVGCKFIMDAERHSINMALREYLVEQGFSLPEHQETIENLTSRGHPEGETRLSPGAWAEGLDLKIVPEERAEVLLFAGCAQNSDDKAAIIANKFARLLRHAGVDVGILGDGESCCGLPAYWTGHREVFTSIANRILEQVGGLGVKTLVMPSGSCLGAFRSKYPEYAGAFQMEVLHASELLARLIAKGRLRLTRPVPGTVTYHDPCYLGRQSEPPLDWEGEEKRALGCMNYFDPPKPVNRGTNGVFDPPRNILGEIPGLRFVEMYRIREYSFCCGAGGGVPEAYPDLARAAALHRIEEARAVGAERLVTACAHCERNLARAQETDGDEALPILDLIELVFEAAGLSD